MKKVTSSPVLVFLTFNDKPKAGVGSSIFWSAVYDLLPNYLLGESENPFVFSESKEHPYDIGIHLFPEYQGKDFACRIVFTGLVGDTISILEIKHFKEFHVAGVDDFKHDVLKQTRFVFQKAKELLENLFDQRLFAEENDITEIIELKTKSKILA